MCINEFIAPLQQHMSIFDFAQSSNSIHTTSSNGRTIHWSWQEHNDDVLSLYD